MPVAVIDNPILNGPYDPPSQHFELGDQGPTGEVLPGRRKSESFIPGVYNGLCEEGIHLYSSRAKYRLAARRTP